MLLANSPDGGSACSEWSSTSFIAAQLHIPPRTSCCDYRQLGKTESQSTTLYPSVWSTLYKKMLGPDASNLPMSLRTTMILQLMSPRLDYSPFTQLKCKGQIKPHQRKTKLLTKQPRTPSADNLQDRWDTWLVLLIRPSRHVRSHCLLSHGLKTGVQNSIQPSVP